MKAELVDLSECKKNLDIEIPQEVVDAEITHIAQELARRARVPGFRPGKAPVAVVKTRFRDEIVSEMMQHLMPKYFGDAIDERKLEARHRLLVTANVHRAMIRTARRWNANRIQRDARLISQPTMLIWGEEDTHIPIEEAFRLRDAIPNNRLVVFRNCGHLPPTESPEQFVEVISEFCQHR